ncbi:hypothetical protein SADUNF_Sadunf17G0093000 [Salix dunnii]|uniref:Uncharacterized protein n=1 Tax=Salix dunnii TaxID=1413687 RepID=A0A835MET8_9ROSI|nr:hypothetical protein SADUNF_Sadunf17G0093000 [Salix dunnii]
MDGDLPLYSIADSNLDSEFMMDSEINWILASPGKMPGNPLDRLQAPFNSGRANRYNVPKGPNVPSCKSVLIGYNRARCQQFLSSTRSYSMPMRDRGLSLTCTLCFRELVKFPYCYYYYFCWIEGVLN